MDWPQIVIIVFLAFSVGIDVAKHGEPRKGKHNFLIALLANGLVAFILWQGGFFT